MRSSVAARMRTPLLLLAFLLIACALVLPSSAFAFADEGEGASFVASDATEGGLGGEANPPAEGGSEATAPLTSVLAKNRTYILPADALANFSVTTIATATMELVGKEEEDVPTLRTTFVADGCVYGFDEDAGAFSLLNAANAELTEEGFLLVPSALEREGAVYPVTSIAAGALSGVKARLVAFSSHVDTIDPEALFGAEKIEAVFVSPESDIYSSFDGCLYGADPFSLLLIPEGRTGTVRIASGAEVDPGVLSHCSSVDSLSVDADGAAFLFSRDAEIRNAQDEPIAVVVEDAEMTRAIDAPLSSSVDWSGLDEAVAGENGVTEDTELAPDEASAAPLRALFALFSARYSEQVDDNVAAVRESEPAAASSDQTPVILSSVMPLTGGSTIAFSGDLPTLDGDEASARWELVGSTLHIRCKEGSIISGAYADEAHVPWYGVRNLVTAVAMEDTVRTDSMAYWFCSMTQLTDLSAAFIPDGCTDVRHLLRSSAITSVPESFVLPASVKNASGMFESCVNLTSLPNGFTLAGADGSGVAGADCESVFEGCVKLESLPEGFALPGGVSLASAFERCWALTSLPASISPIPASATNVSHMFYDLSALRILPAGFDFPSAAVGANSPEFLGLPAERDVIATYCTGPSANLQNWFAANSASARRTLTDSATGAAYMQFMVPDTSKDPSDADYWRVWKTLAADERGIVANPGPYVESGSTFAGWFSDRGAGVQYLFDLPYDNQPYHGSPIVNNVYACMVADSAPRGGNLPNGVWKDGVVGSDVVDVVTDSRASWELTSDGVLKIRCQAGRVISVESRPWYDVLRLVTKVEMEAGLQTDSMLSWFSGTSIVDTEGIFVPEGCKSTNRMLQCTYIKTVHEGFALPASVVDPEAMFEICLMLETLPEGLTFSHLSDAKSFAYLFNACVNLQGLPDSFALPEGATSFYYAFNECRRLASLPPAFSVPSSAEYVSFMFGHCPALRILPASFDFPKTAAGANEAGFLGLPESGEATATYYPGTSQTVKDWFATAAVGGFGGFGGTGPVASKSNRTLTDSATGAAYMQFMVPDTSKDPSDAAYWKVWKTEAADGNGLVADPGFEFIDGYAFSGWYINQGFYLPFDFSLPYNDQPSTTTVVTTVYAKYVGPILDCIVPVETDLSIDVIKVVSEESAVSEPDTLRFYTYNATPVKVSAVAASDVASEGAKALFRNDSDRKTKVFLDLIVDGGRTIALPLVSSPGASPISIPNGELANSYSPICKELSATVRLRTSGKPAITTAPTAYDGVASLIWTIEATK